MAIGFGLCTVWVIALVLHGESAQLNAEMMTLPIYCLLFVALSAVSGAALYSLFKRLKWRWAAQAGMWVAVAAVAWFSLRR